MAWEKWDSTAVHMHNIQRGEEGNMGKHGETIIYVNIQFIQWFIIIMSSSIDQGLDSRSLLEKVEPHAEVTWLRPAEIWSRYLARVRSMAETPVG